MKVKAKPKAGRKASISVDIDKEILLKFKSLCILKETTMSEEIEKMVREWVADNKGSSKITEKEPEWEESEESEPAADDDALSDDLEDDVESR